MWGAGGRERVPQFCNIGRINKAKNSLEESLSIIRTNGELRNTVRGIRRIALWYK